MYMSTSKKRLVNQLGPLETPWIMEGSHFHVGVNIQISLLIERWNHLQGVGHDMTQLGLGGYHKFMIIVGFGFHKVIYKRVWFSPNVFSMLGKGINI
jgi:hypothetical protein